MPVPAAYKEAAGDWKPAAPQAAAQDRGPWWIVFQDADLNALEDKVTAAIQDLKAAVARYDEARAAASVARAGLFPIVTADADVSRIRNSQTIAEQRSSKPFTNYQIGADLSYEIDVWGRVRNAVAAGQNRADASAADVATMDLSLHAELATDYFSLRGDDASQKLLDETVVAYQKALELTQRRHDGGVAAQADVDQAKRSLAMRKRWRRICG